MKPTNQIKNSPTQRAVIPPLDKIRRAQKSPSFLQTGNAKYSITRNGVQETLNAQLEKTLDGFAIYLTNSKGQEIAGIEAKLSGKKPVYHRYVHPPYRGYNLGKLILRLVDQESAKRGFKTVRLNENQQDTIKTALSIGYELTAKGEEAMKKALGLKQGEKLPPKKELISLLRSRKIQGFPRVEVKRNLPQKAKKPALQRKNLYSMFSKKPFSLQFVHGNSWEKPGPRSMTIGRARWPKK